MPNKQELLDDFEQNIFGYRIQEKSDVSVIGVPLKPMVGRPAKSVEEVLKEMKPDLICEIKYDGERTQIHYNDGEINLFSRNFDNQN